MVNTWNGHQFIGVPVPRPDTNLGRINGPGEGDVVQIVCQVRDGRLVTDQLINDKQESSKVWDRVTDGYYISDLYTDLPKVTGSKPPPGVPTC